MTTIANSAAAVPPEDTQSLGRRLDALISRVDRQPLIAVGAGIVIGFLLARLLQR